MKDLRQAVRYAVENVYSGRVAVEFHGKEKESGRVLDLSGSGLSFETELGYRERPDGVSDGEDFFITLNIDGISILIGVEKIWNITDDSNRARKYKAGLKFKILADEDRLKLNSAVEKIRKNIQKTARIGHQP
ncbi:MAG TPA: PilZ domain-containing protein [Spirochaetota bacterium]|nr:PilZ domain-containing protein [Spirochaetota bacterium]HPJ34073.1 PilZ domain-containing protein [Spirochaetota bacterium]